MKRLFFFFFLICFFQSTSYGQYRLDNHWFFCLNSLVNESTLGSAYFDFRDFPPADPVYIENAMDHDYTNAVISDSMGNLLFYTNGCWIANRNHEMMLRGDSLNLAEDGTVYHTCQNPDKSGYRSNDGALILPQPGNDSMYFLFHYREQLSDSFTGAFGIYYTTINMHLDSGLGGVVEKNVPMEEDWVWDQELKAVRHANNRDWWIVNQDRPETDYLRWLLSPQGLSGPFRQQNMGPTPRRNSSSAGFADFSLDGKYYVRNLRWMDVLLYEFDRATGELSGPVILKKKSDTTVINDLGGGVAFSPSGQFLYSSTTGDTLWQWDLWASDIPGSATVVEVWDGFEQFPNGNGLTNLYQLRLGPDCRIYISPSRYTTYLHVINWPDRKGVACDVQQRAILLPCGNINSLPNFANYRLGTPYPVCDTSLHSVSKTIVATSQPVQPSGSHLTVSLWPNPASDQVYCKVNASPSQRFHLRLFNSLGQQVQFLEVFGNQNTPISVQALSAGIYWVSMVSQQGERVTKKLVVRR